MNKETAKKLTAKVGTAASNYDLAVGKLQVELSGLHVATKLLVEELLRPCEGLLISSATVLDGLTGLTKWCTERVQFAAGALGGAATAMKLSQDLAGEPTLDEVNEYLIEVLMPTPPSASSSSPDDDTNMN